MPLPPASISVVVPVHNEADFIPRGLPQLVEATRSVFPDAEILIIENGSTDGTAEAVRACCGDDVTLLTLAVADYGTAMREGVLAARGAWAVTFDIDYFSATFLELLTQHADEADLIIASKRDPLSEDRRPRFRRLATFGFNLLLRTILGSRVSDTHGIKAFRMETARRHAELVVSRTDLYDTELVMRLERAGVRIVEVPVVVEELRPARSALIKRVPRTIKGLLAIRGRLD